MFDKKNLEKLSYRLQDPEDLNRVLDIVGCDAAQLKRYLKSMILIRMAEQRIAEGRKDGVIGGPVHLGVGQEAIAVGVSSTLQNTDRVFGAHRSHSQILALGAGVHGLFAEVLGKDTGVSRGMGGSMHLWDQSVGFYGSVPIVAGTVALAVGAGLAAKMQRTNDVSVAYLGDGAVEEGVVHESLNLARMLGVPILFVVENNYFASHMHISLRQPEVYTSRFAIANNINHKIVDGNNVIAVANAAAELIANARDGNGPGFLEAMTYRWYGHVDWREDIDVGVQRSKDDVKRWRDRDPIALLRKAMICSGMWSENMDQELAESISEEISTAWHRALGDPYPEPSSLLSRVYAV